MSHSLADIRDFFKPRSSGTGVAITTGIISAAAAAGLMYLLFGTDEGARKREEAKAWLKEKKGGFSLGGGELADVSKEIYSDMKAMLRDKATILKKVEKDEVSALADRIRNHWDEIREDIEDTVDKVAEESTDAIKGSSKDA